MLDNLGNLKTSSTIIILIICISLYLSYLIINKIYSFWHGKKQGKKESMGIYGLSVFSTIISFFYTTTRYNAEGAVLWTTQGFPLHYKVNYEYVHWDLSDIIWYGISFYLDVVIYFLIFSTFYLAYLYLNSIIKFLINYLKIIIPSSITIFLLFISISWYYSYRDIGNIEQLPNNIQKKINLDYFISSDTNNDSDYIIKNNITHKYSCDFCEIASYDKLLINGNIASGYSMKFSEYKTVLSSILEINKDGNFLIIKENIFGYNKHGMKIGIAIYDLNKNKTIFRKILQEFDISMKKPRPSDSVGSLSSFNRLDGFEEKIVFEKPLTDRCIGSLGQQATDNLKLLCTTLKKLKIESGK